MAINAQTSSQATEFSPQQMAILEGVLNHLSPRMRERYVSNLKMTSSSAASNPQAFRAKPFGTRPAEAAIRSFGRDAYRNGIPHGPAKAEFAADPQFTPSPSIASGLQPDITPYGFATAVGMKGADARMVADEITKQNELNAAIASYPKDKPADHNVAHALAKDFLDKVSALNGHDMAVKLRDPNAPGWMLAMLADDGPNGHHLYGNHKHRHEIQTVAKAAHHARTGPHHSEHPAGRNDGIKHAAPVPHAAPAGPTKM